MGVRKPWLNDVILRTEPVFAGLVPRAVWLSGTSTKHCRFELKAENQKEKHGFANRFRFVFATSTYGTISCGTSVLHQYVTLNGSVYLEFEEFERYSNCKTCPQLLNRRRRDL